MTVSPYGYGGVARRTDESFRTLKGSLSELQAQLTSGAKGSTYSELGAGAAASLAARARLAGLDARDGVIQDAQLRVDILSGGLAQLEKLARGLETRLAAAPPASILAQTTARDGLALAIDVLNADVAGRYLYSGRAADTQPVSAADAILEGSGGRAGLRQLVAERREADRGPDGLGRLVLSSTGTAVTLAEEAAGLPFGLKLDAAAATGSGIAATSDAGPPASLSFTVSAQPAAGDVVTVTLRLPDGSATALTLTAGTSGSGHGGFAIGATPAATAANLSAALESSLRAVGDTTLAAASSMQASRAFFAGSAASPPARVAGPPFATATAQRPGTADDTVAWYAGDAGTGSARETSAVRTGEGAAIAIGARANEPAIQALLASLGALAVETPPASNAASQARYAALTDRIAGATGATGLTQIATDLSLADVALDAAAKRNGLARSQLGDVVGGAEGVDLNEVAVKLLEAQTRLQASYQTTAAIGRLSLIDYL